EQASGARIGVHLRIEPDVRRCGALASHGTGGHRSVGAERHLTAHDALDALPRGKDQHDVARLNSCLEADAAAGEVHENWIAPRAVAVAHGQHALAAASAENQTDLDDLRDDGDAV